MRIWILWLATPALMANFSIRGHVQDGTNGGAGQADRVQLVRLGSGMQVVGAVDDVRGDFEISYDGDWAENQFLVQAVKGKAIYSQTLKTWKDAVHLTVYDVADTLPLEVRLTSMAIYAYEEGVDVAGFFSVNNTSDPPKTLDKPGGTFSFQLAPGAHSVAASTRRGSMPLRQAVEVSQEQASISYPLKPGVTQVMTRMTLDLKEEQAFSLPLLEEQDSLNLLVIPNTVEISGEGLQFMSEDPSEGLKLYQWTRQEGQVALNVKLTGEPAAQRGETTQAAAPQGHQPKVERRPNILQPYRWYIIGFMFLVLGISSCWSQIRKTSPF